jgi:hypothetical protein
MAESLTSAATSKGKSKVQSAAHKSGRQGNADPNEGAFGFLSKLAKGPYCGLRSHKSFVDTDQLCCGQVVGRGAYSTVQVAWKQRDRRKLALKELKPKVAEDKVELKFFLLEAHIISSLQHPCAPTPRVTRVPGAD